MAHDRPAVALEERQADGHDASVWFGGRGSSFDELVSKVDLVTRSKRLMKAHLVVSEGCDHGVLEKLVNETLLHSEDEQTRRCQPAVVGCDLVIDVDRKWIPPPGEVHHLVTINNDSRTCHALARNHVLEVDHPPILAHGPVCRPCSTPSGHHALRRAMRTSLRQGRQEMGTWAMDNAASHEAYRSFPLLGDKQFLQKIRDDPSGYFRPDLVREDRRAIVGAPTTRSLTEYVDHAMTWLDLSETPPAFSVEEVVAVRGDTCALIRCRVSFGEAESEFLNAFLTTPEPQVDGFVRLEVVISVLFDLDDREAAIAELDRIYAEIEPEEQRRHES